VPYLCGVSLGHGMVARVNSRLGLKVVPLVLHVKPGEKVEG
jgi:hypothetical protein